LPINGLAPLRVGKMSTSFSGDRFAALLFIEELLAVVRQPREVFIEAGRPERR
jgi:hypothetical protein